MELVQLASLGDHVEFPDDGLWGLVFGTQRMLIDPALICHEEAVALPLLTQVRHLIQVNEEYSMFPIA